MRLLSVLFLFLFTNLHANGGNSPALKTQQHNFSGKLSTHNTTALLPANYTDDWLSAKNITQAWKTPNPPIRENKFSKLISILSLALIAILSLLCTSLYRNNVIRQHTNTLLKEKNIELVEARIKAERASAARTEFLSTVSHELRTPLNAITGITHLLIEENPKPSQLEYLDSLRFSGNYLLNYINDILETNRIEAKNIEIETIAFDLKKLLSDIHNALKEITKKNNNRFILEIDPDISECLLGDPTKLSQIFLNLANNALKFTHDGEISITVKQFIIDSHTVNLSFEVSDTGIGIPEDQQQLVFESFSQASVEINRKYGGTGLGLAIVKRLVQLLGGDIQLHSEVGKGSTFSFNLDFKQGIAKDTLPLFKIDESCFVSKRILLVEDNKINQMIICRLVEKKKIVCQVTDNGEEAVILAKTNKYDLILMDVHLPGINGTIAAQQIREFDPHIPIIALTAISLMENREMLLSYGMNEVITKPFEPNHFFKTLMEYLKK